MLGGVFASHRERTRSTVFGSLQPIVRVAPIVFALIVSSSTLSPWGVSLASANSDPTSTLTGRIEITGERTTVELSHGEVVILSGVASRSATGLAGKQVVANGQWLAGLAALGDLGGRVRVFSARSIAELPSDESATTSAAMTTTVGVPTGFLREDVVTGMVNPVGFDFAPDGRIFIAQKNGIVRVFENGTLLATPFIDITAEVNNVNDRGLLGIAVHPQFPTLPYIYLLYTYDPPEIQNGSGMGGPDGNGNRVSRMIRVEGDPAQNYNVADLATKTVILGTNSTFDNIGDPNAREGTPSCEDNGVPIEDCIPIDERSHTIGTVAFAPDGSLFVGNGDGSSQSTALMERRWRTRTAASRRRVDPGLHNVTHLGRSVLRKGRLECLASRFFVRTFANPGADSHDAGHARAPIGH